MSRIALLLSACLYACETEEPTAAPRASDTAAEDTAAEDTAAEDTAAEDTAAEDTLLTGDDLAGNWASTGCEAYDDGTGGKNYLTRSFALTPDRWDLTLTVFGDADCSYGLFTAEIEGPYTLGGTATVDGATNGDFAFTSNVWTPLVEDLAVVFEQAGCASGEWEVGAGQDVTTTGCIGVAHPIAECPVEHDIVKVQGDDLYLGARVTDMCAESGRPTALADYPVRR